jgi:hypothetical protein
MRAIESTKRKLEHMRKRGSEDHQKLTSSEVLKIIRSWKTGSFKIVSNAVLIKPIIAEG